MKVRLALPLFGAGLAVVATGLATGPALAADVVVEEFGALTRITVPGTPAAGWTVRNGNRSIDLRKFGTDLDLESPPLADGGRLETLGVWKGPVNAGVSIHFSCDCEATHYYNEGGSVIIDVTARTNPLPMEAATTTEWVGTPQPPRPEQTFASTVIPTGRVPAAWNRSTVILAAAAPERPAPPRQRNGEPWRLANILVATPLPRPKPAIGIAKTDPAESEDAAIDALRDSILEKLALGVEQGRIVMDTGPERGGGRYVPAGCADEAALDLKRLTGSDDFRAALPRLRADVYDDMKQLNPAAVRTLARHFIAFGLGAEARNVIAAFETSGPPERMILDMASILEGETDGLGDSLLLKPDCGPRAAVWRGMVAAEAGDGTVAAIYDTAREAIYDVPGPLRKILGARIAVGLIDEGQRETAMRLWRNLQVATGPATPEMQLLGTYAVEGTVLDRMLGLSETRSPIAVEAALRAADMLAQTTNRGAAERLGTTLDDLAFLYRDSQSEAPLSLAQAKLQARYGDLASALTGLAEKAEKHPERADHWRGIAHETIRVATEGADPVARPLDFDTILSSLRYLDDSPASDAAKLSLARKLLNIGGAHIVDTVLTAPTLKRSTEARRLLAEARLLTGDAPGARKLLAGLGDDESAPLRDRAAAMGRTITIDSARALFAPVKRPPETASISAARDLLDEADADLSIIEELLADG